MQESIYPLVADMMEQNGKKFTKPVLLPWFKQSHCLLTYKSPQGYWKHGCNFCSFWSYEIPVFPKRGPFWDLSPFIIKTHKKTIHSSL